MNAVDTGPFASLLLLVLSSLGLPLGVPPQAEDIQLARVAPQDCLAYASWAGSAEPDPESSNQVEQLLAEPQIRQLLASLDAQLAQLADKASTGRGGFAAQALSRQAIEVVKTVLSCPGCVFLEDFTAGPEGFDAQGAVIVNAGDRLESLRTALEGWQQAVGRNGVERVRIADADFSRFRFAEGGPVITWGAHESYLVVGVGEGAVEGIAERAEGEPPQWLVDVRRTLSVPRVSTLSYVNAAKLRGILLPLAPPEAGLAVDTLGLMEIDRLATVSGLDDTACVSRTLIGIEGEARGLLALADEPGLQLADLQPVPRDPLVALAFRLDLDKLFQVWLNAVGQIEPDAADTMRETIGQLEEQLGVAIRRELLPTLGDVWTLSAGETEGGLVTGWVATLQLRDRGAAARVHDQLLQVARQAWGEGNRSPRIQAAEYEGQTLYTLAVPEQDFPFAPAWCLTDRHLVFALFPQALKSYLARKDVPLPAVGEPLATLLAAERTPFKLFHVDSQKVFRWAYPFAQIGAQAGMNAARGEGVELDPLLLPSPEVIDRHLTPTFAAVRRTDEGIEILARQPLPGSVTAAAPIALAAVLPAVQPAQQSARRVESLNNLKQLGLALHMYYDSHQAIPASCSADADGKPLLSWRVHILPFLEGQELYEQFRLDEPWDSPLNRELIARMPDIYRAPGSQAEAGKTVYLGVRGADKAFLPLPTNPGKGAPLGERLAGITDGTSNTAWVVEASDARAVIWTKPDDFEPADEDPIAGLIGLRPGGFLCSLCDGSVRFIAAGIDRQTLRRLFTKNDGHPLTLP